MLKKSCVLWILLNASLAPAITCRDLIKQLVAAHPEVAERGIRDSFYLNRLLERVSENDVAEILRTYSLQELFSLSIQQEGRESLNRAIVKALRTHPADGSERLETFRQLVNSERHYNQSHILDALLGLDIPGVCRAVSASCGSHYEQRFGQNPIWQHSTSMAQTPYDRFGELSRLPPQPGQLVVDIGAGFGRLGFYLAAMYPGVRFIGFELVPERVQESRRVARLLGIGDHIQFIEQDLGSPDFTLPVADYYYNWLPVNDTVGFRIWEQLARISESGHDFIWIYNGLQGNNNRYYPVLTRHFLQNRVRRNP